MSNVGLFPVTLIQLLFILITTRYVIFATMAQLRGLMKRSIKVNSNIFLVLNVCAASTRWLRAWMMRWIINHTLQIHKDSHLFDSKRRLCN